MKRPLDLRFEGELILESEKAPELLKTAAFYLSKKFENSTDEELKSWLEKVRDNGFMESDEKLMQEDVYRGDYVYLLPVIKKLPPFISLVADQLIEENSMDIHKGR